MLWGLGFRVYVSCCDAANFRASRGYFSRNSSPARLCPLKMNKRGLDLQNSKLKLSYLASHTPGCYETYKLQAQRRKLQIAKICPDPQIGGISPARRPGALPAWIGSHCHPCPRYGVPGGKSHSLERPYRGNIVVVE